MNASICAQLYEITISQFSLRIRQRDSVLLFYLGASGAIAGLAFSQVPARPEILLAVPLFAGACGLIMAYHSLFIEAIIRYCNECLAPTIGNDSCIFERSAPFTELGMIAVLLRAFANFSLLIIPSILAEYYLFLEVFMGTIAWWPVILVGLSALAGAGTLLGVDVLHISCVYSRRRADIERYLSSRRERE